MPGPDLYRTLPSKTLQLLKYALSSPCRYTHLMKTDDDVVLRPQVSAMEACSKLSALESIWVCHPATMQLLMDIIAQGSYNWSVPVQSDGSGAGCTAALLLLCCHAAPLDPAKHCAHVWPCCMHRSV